MLVKHLRKNLLTIINNNNIIKGNKTNIGVNISGINCQALH
jgi:hypothetical protein